MKRVIASVAIFVILGWVYVLDQGALKKKNSAPKSASEISTGTLPPKLSVGSPVVIRLDHGGIEKKVRIVMEPSGLIRLEDAQ